MERRGPRPHQVDARPRPGRRAPRQHGAEGKRYPGESLPRWALEIIARRDARPLWPDRPPGGGDPRAFVDRLAARLGAVVHEAFEDPWKILEAEAALPPDVDPRAAGLDDPEERQRLARILDRGVGRVAGWVLPLAVGEGDAWRSETWTFRRGRLFLLFGDSPLGLRLPLASLGPVPEPDVDEPPVIPPDPRQAQGRAPRPPKPVRTALCVEPREDALWVFLPPLPSFARFCRLVEAIDAVRDEIGIDAALEGYPPPPSPDAFRFSVTPDPGVLEVNIPPSSSTIEYARRIEQVFAAALRSGLHSEKYLLDGRMAGSGGGHHITLGGPTPPESPFLRRPDLLASLLTFLQHHPSLSYLFAGLFIGPTSQAPRVDEARHETLYELEIALARAFEPDAAPPAWLSDRLFRHLLVDMTGNTHRAEVSIDKLFDPATPHGRQGLIELRAFEMPPHPRMVIAQGLLARALIAAFAAEPYRAPLVRWGQALHDRFLLPSVLWRDFEDVLSALADRGVALPAAGYRPFLDLRCPLVGILQAGDVTLEVSNALEPWHVLGEEMTTAGTTRFVDSSVERIEVLASGLVPGRHVVMVNGHVLPLHATPRAGTSVGGVRFRAWAPPHSLHAHLGIHHPIRLDVVDAWAHRSLGGCAYHVWHPEGRAHDTPPLTRFEAAARRAQRFRIEGPVPWPVAPKGAPPHDDVPFTLDLRRLRIDRPMPEPADEEEAAS